jgi:tRNA A37 threonylcarbamoyltransferase TsaD
MNKKRICVTIPYELYRRYRYNLSFSGLLTELLEDIEIVYNSDLSKNNPDIIIRTTINSKPYSISIKDLISYVTYVTGVNKK